MTLQANLTNRDATVVPQPFVKWAYEPPRAQDVPAALARAIHLAGLPPKGPAYVSIPMDDWTAEAEDVAPLVHAHPTQNEALGEAHLALAGKPLHVHS